MVCRATGGKHGQRRRGRRKRDTDEQRYDARGDTKIGDSAAAAAACCYYACQRVGLTNVESIRGDLGTTLHLAKRKKKKKTIRPKRSSRAERFPEGTKRVGARKGTGEANGVITEECVRVAWYDRELDRRPVQLSPGCTSMMNNRGNRRTISIAWVGEGQPKACRCSLRYIERGRRGGGREN